MILCLRFLIIWLCLILVRFIVFSVFRFWVMLLYFCIRVWRVILVGCVVNIRLIDRVFNVLKIVFVFMLFFCRWGYSLDIVVCWFLCCVCWYFLCRWIWWYCLVRFVRLRKWLNVWVIGINNFGFSLDNFLNNLGYWFLCFVLVFFVNLWIFFISFSSMGFFCFWSVWFNNCLSRWIFCCSGVWVLSLDIVEILFLFCLIILWRDSGC